MMGLTPFEHEALQAELPVNVYFPADRCGDCRMVSPLVGELADEYEGRVNERREEGSC